MVPAQDIVFSRKICLKNRRTVAVVYIMMLT